MVIEVKNFVDVMGADGDGAGGALGDTGVEFTFLDAPCSREVIGGGDEAHEEAVGFDGAAAGAVGTIDEDAVESFLLALPVADEEACDGGIGVWDCVGLW